MDSGFYQCLKFPGANFSSCSLESCILARERLLYNSPSIILCDHCLYCLLLWKCSEDCTFSTMIYSSINNEKLFPFLYEILQIGCVVLLYGEHFNVDEILIVVLLYAEIYGLYKSHYRLVCHSAYFSNCFTVIFFSSEFKNLLERK